MSYTNRVLTESYKDKRYEEDLTKLYFSTMKSISGANCMPTLEHIKMAFSVAKIFCESVVLSKEHLERYRDKVKPVFADLQTILYGDPGTMMVAKVAIAYRTRIIKARGKYEIQNGVNILNQISELMFILKQWAYEQGLFLVKPIDKRYGTEAIEDNLLQ